MKTFRILQEVRLPMLALVLLGLLELLVMDMSGNLSKILGLQGSVFFIAASAPIALFSVAIMGWSALKLRLEYGELLTSGFKAGALVGFGAACGICFFLLFLGLFGMGFEKWLPFAMSQQGISAKIFAYLGACAAILLAYPLAGAIMGTAAGVLAAPVEDAVAKKAVAPTAKVPAAKKSGRETGKKPVKK